MSTQKEPQTKDITDLTQAKTTFKGYTLEELRYQRALVMLQREFCKNRMMRNLGNLKQSNPLSPNFAVSKFAGKSGSIASKILSGMSYLDYAMLGFSAFKSVRKIVKLFKR